MKKIIKKYTGILSLLSFLLILPIHLAHSQNIDELFGIKLLDNATNYVSSEYIENNKSKFKETISGFWELKITSVASSPYFDTFYLTIDNYNKIHMIHGFKDYYSKDRCLEFLDTLIEKVETQKQIKFTFYKSDIGFIQAFKYQQWVNNTSISIFCGHQFDPIDNWMSYYIRSEELSNAINIYYEQD